MKGLLQFKNEFIIVALLALFFLTGKGMLASYSAQMQAIEGRQQDFKNHSDILSRWQKVDSEYKKENEKFIFSDASDFKRFVDEKAQSQGVNISYVGPARQDKIYYEEATMALKIMASYKNTSGFIRALESKDIIVDRLAIKNLDSNQGGRKGRSIEMTIKSFVPKK